MRFIISPTLCGLTLCVQLLVAGCATAQQNNAIVFESKASACGLLTSEKHFGPPGFGENPKTDSTFTAWVLLSDIPIALVNTKHPEKSSKTNRIQLYFNDSKVGTDVRNTMAGKKVCASGHSEEAIAPGDIAPVNLSVESVRLQ